MPTLTRPTSQQILNHHLAAFIDADLDEIMKDYTSESELVKPDGILQGQDEIRNFFRDVFQLLPQGSSLELIKTVIRENLVYVAWKAESKFLSVPLGADTFIIENDKIRYQFIAAHMIPK